MPHLVHSFHRCPLGAVVGGLMLIATAAHADRAPTSADTAFAEHVRDVRAAAPAIGAPFLVSDVALTDGVTVDLVLERFTVTRPDAAIYARSAHGATAIDVSGVTLLRGHVAGDPTSRVFLGLGSAQAHGLISGADGLFSISTGPAAGDRVLRITAGADWPRRDDAHALACGAELVLPDDAVSAPSGAANPIAGRNGEGDCRVALIALDSDYEYTALLFGGDPVAATEYALILLGAVADVYQRDFNIRLAISHFRTWTENVDPYGPIDQMPLHTQIQTHWTTQMTHVERDVVHLLTPRTDLPYGGIGYIESVCESYATSLTAAMLGSFPFPLQDNQPGNWDPYVVAHEIGHTFGTPHTHEYLPPLDGCGLGNCATTEGTIMSYCHLCPGGTTNSVLRFHPVVVGRILAHLNEKEATGQCDMFSLGVTALDDAFEVVGTEPVLLDVLHNELLETCDILTILESGPGTAQGGTALRVEGPTHDLVQYTPPAGFVGTDSFTYLVNAVDGDGPALAATVTVEVRPDCNVNAQDDALEVQTLVAESTPALGPVGAGIAHRLTIFNARHAAGEVALTLAASADLDQPFEWIDLTVNENHLGRFFQSGAGDCADPPNSAAVLLDAATFNAYFVEGNALDIRAIANNGVDAMACDGASWLTIGVSYPVLALNDDNGNGVPDDCECAADLDRSGAVEFNDLVAVLAAWGPCVTCPEDLDASGAVTFEDLLTVLATWGECP